MTFALRTVREEKRSASDKGSPAEQEKQRERDKKAKNPEAAEEYAPVSRAVRCL